MRFIAVAFALIASLSACAEEATSPAKAKYEEGVHYNVLPAAVRTITPGKIEVTEAYSYSCGHCFKFEPLIKAWEKKMPEGAKLVKLPVIWNNNPNGYRAMQLLARTMYTGEALGISDKVNAAMFEKIHVDHSQISSEEDIAKIFAEFGVSEEKFSKTFNSFGVSSQVQQAESRTRSMEVRGTPQLIVDGKYTISATRELGHTGMLQVAEYLVEKIKAEKAK